MFHWKFPFINHNPTYYYKLWGYNRVPLVEDVRLQFWYRWNYNFQYPRRRSRHVRFLFRMTILRYCIMLFLPFFLPPLWGVHLFNVYTYIFISILIFVKF